MPDDQIFPILKQSADISKYAKYVLYLEIALGLIFAWLIIHIIIVLIRRHVIPAYKMKKNEEKFFLAFAHAFNLDDEEIDLVKRLMQKEKISEPHLVFCSAKIFDPCFRKEIDIIQKKRLLPDWKKGQEIDQIYQIRNKIY